MSEARFDLVILHHASDKSVEDLVQELLQLLGKAGDPYLEYKLSEALLFEQSSSAILDSVEQAEGERYQQKFRQLKVETELRPTLQLVAKKQPVNEADVEQYTCPACKHTQPKQTTAEAMNTCNRCGVVGEKLARSQRKTEIFLAEKRKLEKSQSKEMEAAAIRAHTEDEAAMRQEAQEKLGLRRKKNAANAVMAVGGIIVIGAASFFIVDTMIYNSEEIATTDTATDTAEVTEGLGAEKQPLITIQAGNGSIIVNNNSKPEVDNVGTSGAKGTAGEGTDNGIDMAEGQLAGKTTTTQADQSSTAAQGEYNTDFQTSPQLAASTDPAAANFPAPQQTSTITTNSGTLENQQLATLSSATQKTMDDSNVKQAAVKAREISATLSKIITPPTELNILSAILNATHAPEYFFNKLNKKQYEGHQLRLQRLLKLGKPELALIFAEGMDDPHPASLMLLDIAEYVAKSKDSSLFGDLLLSMKTLASKGNTAPQKAVLNANLSQIYHFSGDQSSAQALLEQSVKLLEDKETSRAQQCHLLGQIEQKQRKYGNTEGAAFITEIIANFAANLADKDYIYSSRAYAHLAAVSLTENNQDDAKAWLKQIPVKDARQYLLAQMESMSAAADKAAN